MNNLQTLSDKLHEYNQTHSTAWAILLCTPRTDEVFIVDEEDNKKSPSWWPNNSTGETIEKALELVPKEEMFRLTAYGNKGGQLALAGRYTKSQLKQIADLCL